MATGRKIPTVVRVKKYKGRNVFRQGQLRPMYALPNIFRGVEVFVSRPSVEIAGDLDQMLTSPRAKEEFAKTNVLLPEWFAAGDFIRIHMNPAVFRSHIVNIHRDKVFTKVK